MPNSYTIERKLSLVAWHKNNGKSLRGTAMHFGIDRKRIREWIAKESELQQRNYGQQKMKRKIGSGRKPLSEEMDYSLFEYLATEREAGRIVSNMSLQNQAVKIAVKLGISNFKASNQYINNWKKRYNISIRKAPKSEQKRRADRGPIKNDRLCSCHFQDGKKENDPSIFDTSKNNRSKFIRAPRKKRKSSTIPSSEDNGECDGLLNHVSPNTELCVKEGNEETEFILPDLSSNRILSEHEVKKEQPDTFDANEEQRESNEGMILPDVAPVESSINACVKREAEDYLSFSMSE